MDKHVLNLRVAVGAGVADDDDAIVAICRIANGGEDNAACGDTGQDQGVNREST